VTLAPDAVTAARRRSLRADCSQCFALCCVALAFERSSDFATTKPAGEPCRNLADDFRCAIHASLRPSGFAGCTVFDCFGAGQKVSREVFGGVSWLEDPTVRPGMFAVFPVVRQLNELLWFLAEARRVTAAGDLAARLDDAYATVEALSSQSPETLAALDVQVQRERIRPLLIEASAAARARYATGRRRLPPRVRPGADLIGANLRGADLRGADLRGAYLIGAVLADADLRGADLLGADLRDADVRGAELGEGLFLTQAQVNAVHGDERTTLPADLARPARWPGPPRPPLPRDAR
jgi:hypothetical protein